MDAEQEIEAYAVEPVEYKRLQEVDKAAHRLLLVWATIRDGRVGWGMGDLVPEMEQLRRAVKGRK